MFIEATKLIGLAVGSLEEQAKIGMVKEILVDFENGHILGLLIQEGGIFSQKKVLSVIDIITWDPKGIVTYTQDNLVEPKEIVRLKKIIDQKKYLLNLKAKTENGQNLGIVENFLVDTDAQTVVKYYLKDILGHKRIFGADRVSRIDNHIIFTDDVTEPPKGAVSTTT